MEEEMDTEEKNSLEETECEENNNLDNLKVSLDIAKSQLQSEKERCARLDNKFNFMLVFLAAQIAGLHLLFPLPEANWKHITSVVLLIEFLLSIFCAGLMVLLGMYPKQNMSIDAKSICDPNVNAQSHSNLLKAYIDVLTTSISSYQNTNGKKGRLMKLAFIFSIIAFVLFCILIVIKAI